jgi:hypothetical protein
MCTAGWHRDGLISDDLAEGGEYQLAGISRRNLQRKTGEQEFSDPIGLLEMGIT